MGLSKLNVWLTETDNPCKINDKTFYVSVFTCDGEILKWAGKEYKLLEALNGHLEVDLPPGCYYLRAASIHCENAYSDTAVVRVRCGETACVTLMLPSLRRCGEMLNAALRFPRARELIPLEILRPVQDAVTRMVERLPTPVHMYELAHLEETRRFILKPRRAERKRTE
ncbi:MAG: hypothetical protein PVF15_05105 [Candidatus Bathyarchaeota archaeon]